jgi:AcrR family transcriptional regulator
VGHKFSRDELLAGAVAVALEDGLSELTFGRLASRLGISDRVAVYYFPSKSDLVGDVLRALGSRLQGVLATAFDGPAADHLALARAAWPTLARADVDPLFKVFFEANGLAAAGRQPYRDVVSELVAAWADWLTSFLDGPLPRRRAEAHATIALVDGLLLLRQVGGADAATRAARALHVVS